MTEIVLANAVGAVLASAHHCGTGCRSRTARRTQAIGTATPETQNTHGQGNMSALFPRFGDPRSELMQAYDRYAAVADLSLARALEKFKSFESDLTNRHSTLLMQN